GGGLLFDVVDDRVIVPHVANLAVTGAITIAAWFEPRGLGLGDFNYLVGKSGNAAYQLKMNSARNPYTSMTIGGVRKNLTGETPLDLDVLHHLVATFDGINMRIYQNGNLDGTLNAPGLIDSTVGNVQIGGTGNEYIPDGIIKDIRIYNRALSGAEVKTQYEQGETRYLSKAATKSPFTETLTLAGSLVRGGLKALYDKIGLVAPDSSCVLRLDFDENRGTIAKDTSGYQNDGTMVGAPAWVDGKYGKAHDVDSTNYVNLGAGKFDTLTDGTICAWVKPHLLGS
ncbi:unnamed protein product, partial [marine sediment metagenome]